MIKISTKPYKGTSDDYPEDMYKRNYLFNIWKKVARQFGYEEYDTPILENAEMYRAKSGEELSKQLYNFTDKGGREVAIKPEMTPSLARMIAAKGGQIARPIRWFNNSKYYRYEKPQAGRTREFYQLNIDIFGIETIQAEVEMFQFIMKVMEELKAPKDSYTLYVNNRYFMDYIFENVIQIKKDQYTLLAKALDNYTKLEETDFIEYLKDLGLNEIQVKSTIKFTRLGIKGVEQYKEKSEGANQLLELFKILNQLKITNIEFKPYIVRGLAYYTGTVFEMFETGNKSIKRALLGGGRYDNLLDLFDMQRMPAVGFAWGDITMQNYLEAYELIPTYKSESKIYISLLDKNLFEYTSKLAQTLRQNNINVEQQLTPGKINKQIAYAIKKGFKYIAIIGEEEFENGTVTLKNLETREQKVVVIDKVTKILIK